MTASLARAMAPLALLCLCLGVVAPAAADELAAEEPQAEAASEPTTAPEAGAEPVLGDLAPPTAEESREIDAAIEDWQRRRHWRYGTQYLFSLTRGMDEAGIPRTAQYFLYALTVPLDLAQLPFGALGGLYGD